MESQVVPTQDEWQLTLNRYQRDNLLDLLRACRPGDDALFPFTVANTGDWLGEVYNQIVVGPPALPNVPISEALAAAAGSAPECSNCSIMATIQRKLSQQVHAQRTKLDSIMMSVGDLMTCLGSMSRLFDESDTIDWRERRGPDKTRPR